MSHEAVGFVSESQMSLNGEGTVDPEKDTISLVLDRKIGRVTNRGESFGGNFEVNPAGNVEQTWLRGHNPNYTQGKLLGVNAFLINNGQSSDGKETITRTNVFPPGYSSIILFQSSEPATNDTPVSLDVHIQDEKRFSVETAIAADGG